MKFVGVFSKDARQMTQGTTSTISFKGNKMRREDSLGQIEIIDLDGRRITQIDTKKKTYSTMTFDEMKARMEEARKKAADGAGKAQQRAAQPGENYVRKSPSRPAPAPKKYSTTPPKKPRCAWTWR